MTFAATYRLGTRLFWRDRGMLVGSVVTPVGLTIGMPVLMRNVAPEGVAAATQVFHGMIAVVLAITTFMTTVVTLTMRRDQLVLKRLRTTELTDGQILAGQLAGVVTQTVLLVGLSTLAVRVLAGVPLPANPPLFAAAVVTGAVVMALLAAAYTAVIPRAELSAAFAMPVFLLAGVGAGVMGPIPLPSFARTALDLLPTAAVADAVRHGEVLAPVLNLAVWTVIGVVSLRLWFRWEPRRSSSTS
ncbi:ABC transporter permease [Nonomuraea sp. MCN248]|uniref:ABC transporter permease n=1 Tax=Nonomuraea corallina TaxID=2989783 RepID=A0ABT4SEB8_9ACTN|nr:ABC transporter permease [Nonomuraea corallina]MDA0635500.1 ABC transporter permease [Nonomuraea corallina]